MLRQSLPRLKVERDLYISLLPIAYRIILAPHLVIPLKTQLLPTPFPL